MLLDILEFTAELLYRLPRKTRYHRKGQRKVFISISSKNYPGFNSDTLMAECPKSCSFSTKDWKPVDILRNTLKTKVLKS